MPQPLFLSLFNLGSETFFQRGEKKILAPKLKQPLLPSASVQRAAVYASSLAGTGTGRRGRWVPAGEEFHAHGRWYAGCHAKGAEGTGSWSGPFDTDAPVAVGRGSRDARAAQDMPVQAVPGRSATARARGAGADDLGARVEIS